MCECITKFKVLLYSSLNSYHHFEGCKETLAGVKLVELGQDVLDGSAEFVDRHGQGSIEDAG